MTLPHHSLIAWQRADDLFFHLHALSRRFPTEEKYELGSQLRRAAFSVAVNIVEGYGREGDKEKLLELEVRKVAAPLRGLMASLGKKHPFARPDA